jgi:hypothetical protein
MDSNLAVFPKTIIAILKKRHSFVPCKQTVNILMLHEPIKIVFQAKDCEERKIAFNHVIRLDML